MTMARLRKSDSPLEAAKPAARILEKNPRSFSALNYFRKDFDEAEKKVLEELAEIGFPRNIKEAERRCVLYAMLVDAYEVVMTLPLPLEGNGWHWQPDLKYYAGNLSEAQYDLLKMLEERAEASIAEGKPEKALEYYQKALEHLSDTMEVESNRLFFYERLYARAEEKASRKDVSSLQQAADFYESAYEILPREELLEKRSTVIITIVQHYMHQAELAENNGDWSRALYEYDQVLQWDEMNPEAKKKIEEINQCMSYDQ